MAFNRLSRILVTVCLAIIGLVVPATASHADTGRIVGAAVQMPPLGVNGGGPWELSCGDGEVVTGLSGQPANSMGGANQVSDRGIQCAKLDAEGNVVADSKYWQGTGYQHVECPNNQAAVGIFGSDRPSFGTLIMDGVGLICALVNPSYSSVSYTSWIGYPSGPSQSTSCQASSYLVGTYGRHGYLLDQVGPSCRLYALTPGAPTIRGVVVGSHQATVAMTKPSRADVLNILSYEYSVDGGSSWAAASSNPESDSILISGLNNGEIYAVALRAVNSAGPGSMSDIFAVTPRTTATAPRISSVVEGDRQATVHYSRPSDDGGASIANYEYSTDGGSTWTAASPEQSASPLVLTGLDNGRSYFIAIRAVNVAGAGAASDVLSVTPKTTPSEPNISSAAAGNRDVTVNFSGSVDNGGADISNYEYSTDGGSTWTAASPTQTTSPLVIQGLNNGTTYSVALRAVNSAGSGATSNAVSIKPVALASAPTISGVVAGNGKATLIIASPGQINDSALSGLDYSINNGATWLHFGSVTGPFVVNGLTNGSSYQVKVRAVNSAGAGDASAAVAVSPTKLVPAKPVITSVVAGNASAVVTITQPMDPTSQSIMGYQYSVNKGASYQDAVVARGVFTISGLTNGLVTSVQIRALNYNGASLASLAKTVTPATTPSGPSITAITPSAGVLSIAFTAPNTGGSAITNYQYSLDGGSNWILPTKAVKSSPIKVTGLPNATSYSVKVRAVNAVGIGLASNAVSTSTPAVVASAPSIMSSLAGKTSISVNFAAPTNNGGAEIMNYAYTLDGKTWTTLSPTSGSTQIVITGLTSNKSYSVKIRAINSAGQGAASMAQKVKTLK